MYNSGRIPNDSGTILTHIICYWGLFKIEKTNFSMPVRCANIATETWSPHEGEVYLHILNDNASRCNSGK